jgi:hypothetical protein
MERHALKKRLREEQEQSLMRNFKEDDAVLKRQKVD